MFRLTHCETASGTRLRCVGFIDLGIAFACHAPMDDACRVALVEIFVRGLDTAEDQIVRDRLP